MARFSESWLTQLKQRSDIVDVLSKFLYLERRGGKYWACCPFHREKTASFVVNPEEQYYFCFSCHKSGNVITFLMEQEKMTYAEAVEYLAKRAGMALPEEESPEAKKAREMREKGLAANKIAARFYFDNLKKPQGAVALDYINKRGLSLQTAVEFGIGYSIDAEGLSAHLKAAGYADDTMRYAGLVSAVEGGRLIDFQSGRLIIPIINASGQVIGFGGRILEKGKQPKYKNTSGTPLFDKRRTLFNINMIKKLQRTKNISSLILVEGYMDVISLAQAGIKNVIASMGTSLTTEQCNEIKRYTNKVFVCYDGDAAGQGATWRSLDMLKNTGLEVRVVKMPEGLDPDDTVKQFGSNGYLKYVDDALPLIEFKIKTISERYNLTTMDGKNKFAKAVLSVFADLDDIERDIYVKQVSSLSGLSEDAIKNGLDEYLVRPVKNVAKEEKPDVALVEQTPEFRAKIIACRYVLSSVLQLKNYVGADDLKASYFTYDPHKLIYEYILRCVEKATTPIMGDLFDVVPEHHDEIDKIIAALGNVPIPQQEAYYKDAIFKLKNAEYTESLNALAKKISEATSAEERKNYETEYRKLLKR